MTTTDNNVEQVEPNLDMALIAVNIQIIEQLMEENAQLRDRNKCLDAECGKLEAVKVVIAEPLSDERIAEIEKQTIINWHNSDKCVGGWMMLARAIESAHGITASKGAA